MKIDHENLIDQLKLHNEDALLYVIDEYGGLIKAVIYKNMGCLPGQQEECLNDVLLAIWNHIESFHPQKNSFKNWIAAIAKYKSIDYLRKYKRELTHLSLDEMHTIPSEKNVEQEISERIGELLSCLKEKDRELFIRLYVKEESIEHVSKQMKMNKATIYNRISRARKKMRKGKV